MKKYLMFLLFASCVLTSNAYGFVFEGLQPLAPYGVFSAFSTESLARGNLAVAMGAERSWQPDYYRFIGQCGIGISDSTELDVTIPYDLAYREYVDGLEDVEVVLKHRFFEEGKYGPSFAFLVTGTLPTGREDFTTEGSIGGGIIASKKVGPVDAHVNVLFSRPGTRQFKNDLTFAAGLDFSASHNFKILGEFYSERSYEGSVDKVEARFGYRIVTADNVFTTIGAGFDLKNPQYRLFLTLTYHFPFKKKEVRKINEED
jgi:Putative MetA-pathway of phenol degradation